MLKNNIVMGALAFTLGVVAGAALLPLLADELQSDVSPISSADVGRAMDTEQTSARMIYRATALMEKIQLLRLPAEELPCELWNRAKLEHEIVIGSLEHFSNARPAVLDGAAGVLANNAMSMFQALGDQYEVLCLGVAS